MQPNRIPFDQELQLHQLAIAREARSRSGSRFLLGRIRALGLVVADLTRAYRHRQSQVAEALILAEHHLSRALQSAPTAEQPAPDHAAAALGSLAKAKALVNASLLALAIVTTATLDQDGKRPRRQRTQFRDQISYAA